MSQLEELILLAHPYPDVPASLFLSTPSLKEFKVETHNGYVLTLPDSFFSLDTIQSVSLDSSKFHPTLLQNLTALRSLCKLDLSGGWDMIALPEEIWTLSSLVELSLVLDVPELPESIGQLTRLEYLQLRLDNITFLPDSLSCLTNLTHLGILRGEIQHLPDILGYLTKLKTLKLWSVHKLKSIPCALGGLSRLEILEVWGRRLNSLPIKEGELLLLHRLHISSSATHTLPGHLLRRKNLHIQYYTKPKIPM